MSESPPESVTSAQTLGVVLTDTDDASPVDKQQQAVDEQLQDESKDDEVVAERPRTLWLGDLAFWIDENMLTSFFASTGEFVSAKIIRNRTTGFSEGYGFVEFSRHQAARRVLQTLNGLPIPGTDCVFRLNWATQSNGSSNYGARGAHGIGPPPQEHSIFVGDVAQEVTDYTLQEFFRTQFPSVRSARVVTDPRTGRPKGYGFVRFTSEAERDRAIVEMNGLTLGSRPIRVSLATPKKSTLRDRGPFSNAIGGHAFGGNPYAGEEWWQHHVDASSGTFQGDAHPPHAPQSRAPNTTVFVGNVPHTTEEEELQEAFAPFGTITEMKIAPSKELRKPNRPAYAFIHFAEPSEAQAAIDGMNGTMFNGAKLRLHWGRQNRGQRTKAWRIPGANHGTVNGLPVSPSWAGRAHAAHAASQAQAHAHAHAGPAWWESHASPGTAFSPDSPAFFNPFNAAWPVYPAPSSGMQEASSPVAWSAPMNAMGWHAAAPNPLYWPGGYYTPTVGSPPSSAGAVPWMPVTTAAFEAMSPSALSTLSGGAAVAWPLQSPANGAGHAPVLAVRDEETSA